MRKKGGGGNRLSLKKLILIHFVFYYLNIIEFLGTDCTDPLEDFLTSEAAAAAFREGLGPIDTGDFRMLDDPNLVLPDPHAEDEFRLDRL